MSQPAHLLTVTDAPASAAPRGLAATPNIKVN